MSAMCFLYSGNANPPSWTEYEEDESPLFESNYLIPIAWIALFSISDLTTYADPDESFDEPEHNDVPVLVGKRSACLALLKRRFEFMVGVFPGSRGPLVDFIGKIASCKHRILSLNMFELYSSGDPSEFVLDLRNALLFFEKQDAVRTAALMKMADVQGYQGSDPDFEPAQDGNYGYHVVGLEIT